MYHNNPPKLDNIQFDPNEAAGWIAMNSEDIQTWGAEIIRARNELMVAEAEYLDARRESRIKRLAEMGVTLANTWVEIDTHDKRKAFLAAEHELKNMMENKDIVIECNNNLKLRIKLWEQEYKDTKFTQTL